MPHQINFEKTPAGYVASIENDAENTAQIVFREFLTSEDGMELIQRLEQFPTEVIGMLPSSANVKCSQIDHLLVHFDKNGNGIVYVNELAQMAHVRIRNTVEKGQAVYEDDIIDINQLVFEGIDIPVDHSVLVVFSKGWRKGLYFDFEPTIPNGKPREYDLWEALGQCYNYLSFQEVHSLSDESWEAIFNAAWFPFIGLKASTIKSLINIVKSGQSSDAVLPLAITDIKDRLPNLRKRWASSLIFDGHAEILDVAADRFEAGDWISTNSILYPRIEGVLRNIAKSANADSFHQSILATAPATLGCLPATSRLLPLKFQRYLQEIYFKSFDPTGVAQLSRNSVGHGVAPSNEFSEKAAVLGFLIIEQLFYHIPPLTRQRLD